MKFNFCKHSNNWDPKLFTVIELKENIGPFFRSITVISTFQFYNAVMHPKDPDGMPPLFAQNNPSHYLELQWLNCFIQPWVKIEQVLLVPKKIVDQPHYRQYPLFRQNIST